MTETTTRVLLVEDNPGDALLIRKALRDIGSAQFEVEHVEELSEALERLEEGRFDAVLLDLSLPDAHGLETFTRVHQHAPHVPIVVTTGLSDESMAIRTVHEGAQDYLVKGELDGRTLARALRYAIERKRAEQALLARERQLRAIFEGALDAITVADDQRKYVEVNAAACRLFGLPREALIGKRIEEFAAESYDAEASWAEFRSRGWQRGELLLRRPDGELRYVEFSATADVLPGRHHFALHDITERKLAEAERARLLDSEREQAEQLKLSVREAHHRIKNNLQAISDLLYLELSSESEDDPREALRESMERVQTIALVHDLLSQHEDVQTVDTRAVLERLVPKVLAGSGIAESQVDLELDVASVRLSSKRVTTLALIVNELVSNSVKHAFRKSAGGKLEIRLREAGEELILTVRDDGPGLPDGFDLRTHSHVGLDVVRVMAERDLNGRFTLASRSGLLAEVRFRCSR